MLSLMIDGYNLLHQLAHRPLESLEEERMALVEELQKYQSIKQVPITVVFDGSQPRSIFPNRDRYGRVEIVYTDQGITADEWIADRCREQQGGYVVISSDLEIKRNAEMYRCISLSSSEFAEKLKSIKAPSIHWDMIPEKALDDDLPLYRKVSTKKKGAAKRLPKRDRKKYHQLRQL